MSAPQRLSLVDTLKALAAQVIVLHHLTIYSPWRADDGAIDFAPLGWIGDYGRWAVQVFLVIGGFLAARSIAPAGRWAAREPLHRLVLHRYQRLALPLAAVLIIAVVAAEIARLTMVDDAIPPRGTWMQVLAHLFLVQDLLGIESLSAGVWYVAADLQLFVIFALLCWLADRAAPSRPALSMVLVGAVASIVLLSINTRSEFDRFGLYFFGSYALGALAWWGAAPGRRMAAAAIPVLVAVALVVAFRERLLVALGVAAFLWWGSVGGGLRRWGASPLVSLMARHSYALFLVHFPVMLLVHAAAVHWFDDAPLVAPLALLASWGLAQLAAWRFYERVERRSAAWLDSRRVVAQAQAAAR